jgi:hypothetical protein
MGFITREQQGSKFLNFKEGKIIHAEGGEIKSYDGFKGRVIDLDIEEAEYEGAPYRKIILFIEDEDSGLLYELGFSLESGYGNSFACIAPNIDWKEPIEISGKLEKKQNGRPYSGVFVRQSGKPVKWYYTKEKNAAQKDPKKRPPEPEKIKIGKNEVIDFSKRNDFYENVLASIRDQKIKKVTGGLANYKPKKALPKTADEVTEPIDDLPFD